MNDKFAASINIKKVKFKKKSNCFYGLHSELESKPEPEPEL
jgi:hypothetical protein